MKAINITQTNEQTATSGKPIPKGLPRVISQNLRDSLKKRRGQVDLAKLTPQERERIKMQRTLLTPNGTPRRVFSTGQIALLTRVAPRTVSKWFDSGRIEGYRIPGSEDRRVPREKLVEFLQASNMPHALALLGDIEKSHIFLVGIMGNDPVLDRIEQSLPDEYAHEFDFHSIATSFDCGLLVGTIKPRVVLIDFAGVGRTDAIQLSKSIRKSCQDSPTTIIGFANEDEAQLSSLFDSGFNHVYIKPAIDPDVIINHILGPSRMNMEAHGHE